MEIGRVLEGGPSVECNGERARERETKGRELEGRETDEGDGTEGEQSGSRERGEDTVGR